MKSKRIAKKGSPAVKKWVAMLMLAKKKDRLVAKLKKEEIYHLAGVICCLPSGEKRDQAYTTLRGFLLSSRARIPRLPAALEFLSSEPARIWEIIEALNYFSAVTGASIRDGNLKPDLIIRTMLQVPDHKMYIDHLFQRGFSSLGGIYHPNTLKRTKTELRGLFGGSGEYLANPQDDLNIIHE